MRHACDTSRARKRYKVNSSKYHVTRSQSLPYDLNGGASLLKCSRAVAVIPPIGQPHSGRTSGGWWIISYWNQIWLDLKRSRAFTQPDRAWFGVQFITYP